jgi:hypothetical protein
MPGLCGNVIKVPCKNKQQQEATGDTAGVVRSKLPSGQDVVRQARLSCKTAAHTHLVVGFYQTPNAIHLSLCLSAQCADGVQCGTRCGGGGVDYLTTLSEPTVLL